MARLKEVYLEEEFSSYWLCPHCRAKNFITEENWSFNASANDAYEISLKIKCHDCKKG